MKATSSLTGFTVLILIVLAMTALSGCAAPAGQDSVQSVSMADPDAQTCGICGGKGDATPVDGTVAVEDGVQVCAIGVEEGYLTPNTFTVAAGQPVTLKFEGNATGCLAMPKVGTGTLDEKADFKSGTATLELGALEPGTYPITCGMDKRMGELTVE